MTYRARLVLFAVAAAGIAVLLALAFLGLPDFGSVPHPYGERAVHAAWRQQTANAVNSVVFDQRALDTLGEELIFFASVVGTVVLLRPSEEERRRTDRGVQRTERAPRNVRVVSLLLVPFTTLVGAYLVFLGHLSPGGGFQGGVVVATALHLMYLGGRSPVLGRPRGRWAYELAEAAGAAAYVVVGVVGVVAAGTFLLNLLPHGTFGQLTSAGTVPVLSAAVGVEVASGVIVLLSRFYEQDAELRGRDAA